MTFEMHPTAKAAVKNTHPEQVWFFVMSARSASATALEAHISKTTADRHSRLLKTKGEAISSCVRVGRVVNGRAETM